MIESLIKNLNQDIALLQLRIGNDKCARFNDMARLLESMSIQFFDAVGIANLKSTNLVEKNFPAIDLADDAKGGGIAVQVTSVADAKKINKTIAAFEKKGAAGKKAWRIAMRCSTYSASARRRALRPSAPIATWLIPATLVDQLINLDDEDKVQSIIDSVRRHVDYSSLHPYDDLACLKIILGYVGRNAVRHPMSCEGSLDGMTKGLREISEIIGKGTVNGKHKSKAHHEFDDQEMAEFLRGVLNQIGGITAIVNRAKRDGFVCLSHREMMAIDERKRLIATTAQSMAAEWGIVMPLSMHDDY